MLSRSTTYSDRKLVILAYHKIGKPSVRGWETWNYVPESIFETQLEYLNDAGWKVISVEALLRGLTQPESLPVRAALLTFDDGYRSMRHTVLPVLRRLSLPAAVFVPTAYVGSSNSFDLDIEPEEAMCNWEDLLTLQDAGVSIQSHGVSHRRFSAIHASEQLEELLQSRLMIEEELGRPVEVFAYPYGDCGTEARSVGKLLAQSGYRAGCLYGGGPLVLPVDDHYRLQRVAMGPDTRLEAVLA